jgi:hypothetical protein
MSGLSASAQNRPFTQSTLNRETGIQAIAAFPFLLVRWARFGKAQSGTGFEKTWSERATLRAGQMRFLRSTFNFGNGRIQVRSNLGEHNAQPKRIKMLLLELSVSSTNLTSKLTSVGHGRPVPELSKSF